MQKLIRPKQILAKTLSENVADFVNCPKSWENVGLMTKSSSVKYPENGYFVALVSLTVVKDREKVDIHGYDFAIDTEENYQLQMNVADGKAEAVAAWLGQAFSWVDPAEVYSIASNGPVALMNGTIFEVMDILTAIEDNDEIGPFVECYYSIKEKELIYEKAGSEYILTPEVAQMINLVEKTIGRFNVINIAFLGPTGNGKSSAAKILAQHLGFDFWRENVALLGDTEQLFGFHEARDGNTVFLPSIFTEKLQQGNTVVLLDEANRVPPDILNGILPLLDDDKRTFVHGEEICIGPNTIIVLAMNIGYQYTGTFTSDAALMNRCDAFAQFEFPTENVLLATLVEMGFSEMHGRDLVLKFNELHNIKSEVPISFRLVKRIANMILCGITFPDAIRLTISNQLDKEYRKAFDDLCDTLN